MWPTGLGDDLARTALPGARWLLDRHLAAGEFCVIVSASPQPLVEAAARALGAQRAVGTRAEVCDGRFTGRLEGPFCHGRGKLARLWVELGTADLSRATAYSDSVSDLPLLTASGRPVAVNPDRRLRREARDQRVARPHLLSGRPLTAKSWKSHPLSPLPPNQLWSGCPLRSGGGVLLCAERRVPPASGTPPSPWP